MMRDDENEAKYIIEEMEQPPLLPHSIWIK